MTTEVVVELTEDEVRAGLVHTVLRHTPGLRAMPIMYVAASGALVACIVWFAGGHRPSGFEVLFFALCSAYVFGVPFILREFARRSLRGGSTARYRFDDETVEVQIGRERKTLHWKKMFSVSETSRAFYLHPKPGIFYVLPLRALEDPEAFRAAAGSVPRQTRVYDIYSWLSPSLLFAALLIATALVSLWVFR